MNKKVDNTIMEKISEEHLKELQGHVGKSIKRNYNLVD